MENALVPEATESAKEGPMKMADRESLARTPHYYSFFHQRRAAVLSPLGFFIISLPSRQPLKILS